MLYLDFSSLSPTVITQKRYDVRNIPDFMHFVYALTTDNGNGTKKNTTFFNIEELMTTELFNI